MELRLVVCRSWVFMYDKLSPCSIYGSIPDKCYLTQLTVWKCSHAQAVYHALCSHFLADNNLYCLHTIQVTSMWICLNYGVTHGFCVTSWTKLCIYSFIHILLWSQISNQLRIFLLLHCSTLECQGIYVNTLQHWATQTICRILTNQNCQQNLTHRNFKPNSTLGGSPGRYIVCTRQGHYRLDACTNKHSIFSVVHCLTQLVYRYFLASK